MDKKQYMEFHQSMCNKMVEITKQKNHDYTGKGNDPFANFRNTKNCGGASPLQGFLVRMNDKIARVSSFVEKGILKVKDESVEDTLLDLANYAILMRGYIEDSKEQTVSFPAFNSISKERFTDETDLEYQNRMDYITKPSVPRHPSDG